MNLRALSLSQPWAWVMTMPSNGDRKDVENRTWPCPPTMLGKRFAIHAAKSWDDDGAVHIHEAGLRFPPQATIARGAIVALATIDHQVIATTPPQGSQHRHASTLPASQRRWFFGPYGFVFRDLAVLAKPVPCRGMQGFWAVPDEVTEEVLGHLVAKAREHISKCTYSHAYADVLIAAVRRTGRHACHLDNAAWSAASDRGIKPAEYLAGVS